MLRKILLQSALVATAAITLYGHVTVRPRESTAGMGEKYTMRVPTERSSPTVRVEVEFPEAVEVSGFEPITGWTIDYSKDSSGKITRAVLSGSKIAPQAVAEFVFNARNPGAEATLVWKVVQIYEDGSRSEWTGPSGSRSPAPATVIKQSASKK